jgi:hypothetical protein
MACVGVGVAWVVVVWEQHEWARTRTSRRAALHPFNGQFDLDARLDFMISE